MKTQACALSVLLAFAPIAFSAAPVAAQAAAADPMTEMARERFKEGVKFYDAKDYEKARAAFLQAYALKKHPAVLLNLAQSELRSNHPVEAARHFVQYQRDNTAASALERQEAEKGLAEARTKTGRVAITAAPAGADVLVDGELVGRSPVGDPVDVSAGNHTVEAKHAGHSATVTVTAVAGRIVNASVQVDSSAPPVVVPLPSSGAVGAPAEHAPTGPSADAPAATTAELTTAGPREPFLRWARKSPIAWAGAGLATVGLGMFVGYSIAGANAQSSADSTRDRIKARIAEDANDPEFIAHESDIVAGGGVRGPTAVCAAPVVVTTRTNYGPACASLQDSLDQHDKDKTLATVGIVAAGVGVAGTVAGYYLTAKRGDDAAAAPATATVIAPVYAPSYSGLAIVGSF